MPDTQHVEVTSYRGNLVGPRVRGFLRLRGEDHTIFVRQLGWSQRRAEEFCYDFRGTISWTECVWIGKLLKADPHVLTNERHMDGAPVAPNEKQRFIPAFFTKGDKACGDRLLETLRTLGLASDLGSAITGLVRNVRGFGNGKALKVLRGETPITLATFDLLIKTLETEGEAILGPECYFLKT